jgi:polysaccharide export outer membrane protein
MLRAFFFDLPFDGSRFCAGPNSCLATAEKGFSAAGFSDKMPKESQKGPMKTNSLIHRVALWPVAAFVLAAVFMVVLSGCETNKSQSGNWPTQAKAQSTNDVVLHEADVVKVIFPSDDKLNSSETIRRDGKITLPVIGEVVAAGKTPDQLRKDLVERYSKEIVSSQDISVVVVSSSFSVYVTGAVLKPGKVMVDHPLTVLDAIMEAGGYDENTAQLKSVKVVRTINGKTQTHVVNLKGVQTPGAPVDNFYLEAFDIVIVPTKFVIL